MKRAVLILMVVVFALVTVVPAFAVSPQESCCGLIQKFEGGDIEADITQLPIAHSYLVAKHIGN